jgi:enoyl-CoA hydratase
MAALVTYTFADGVAAITLDDGKANAMSPAMLTELNAALDQAEKDKAAVLLTGRKGVFSAGFDLKVLAAGGSTAFDMLMAGFHTAERLLTFTAPVIVACNGHALAMGVFLVASADYVIAADGAYKIGANEVAIGLTMPKSVSEICRNRLTPSYFSRAMITSEIFTPGEAATAGFVDRVVPEADLEQASREVATRLAKLNRPAYAATKHRVRTPVMQAVRAGIETDQKQLRLLFMPTTSES